jgi:hypothetical protein
MKEHYARNCSRVTRKGDKKNYSPREVGKLNRLSESSRPTSQVREIGCVNASHGDFIELKLDISEEKGLLFPLDTSTDVSVINSKKLIGTAEFDHQQKFRLKCVDGSLVESPNKGRETIDPHRLATGKQAGRCKI